MGGIEGTFSFQLNITLQEDEEGQERLMNGKRYEGKRGGRCLVFMPSERTVLHAGIFQRCNCMNRGAEALRENALQGGKAAGQPSQGR
jgi:hypothetical protein